MTDLLLLLGLIINLPARELNRFLGLQSLFTWLQRLGLLVQARALLLDLLFSCRLLDQKAARLLIFHNLVVRFVFDRDVVVLGAHSWLFVWLQLRQHDRLAATQEHVCGGAGILSSVGLRVEYFVVVHQTLAHVLHFNLRLALCSVVPFLLSLNIQF
mmetsp:Transcript_30511/g.37571  ORF Transcript_30511/g.37571 Transcript_30511/m.37571 type:complete len:157 (-) Transcript_30511:5988-6458(-)